MASERFKEIIAADLWKNARFFRVKPGNLVQWGIPGKPEVMKEWSQRHIKDENRTESNTRGTISFAFAEGDRLRNTQVFINLADNLEYDGFNLVPFGKVVSGMENTVDQIYSGDGDAPIQENIVSEGNRYLKKAFPRLSYIISTKLLGGVWEL